MIQKVLFFLDFANVNRSANDKRIEIDYKHLKDYMGYGRFLLDSYCYVPIDPRNEHKYDKDIQELQKAGYLVTKKVGTYAGNSYKCDFDVEMTMDMMRMAHAVRPDVIVLACGDSDLIPVVTEIRKMGIRVEVASFQSSMSNALKLYASGYIDLDIYYEEYTAGPETGEEETDEENRFPITDEEIEIAIDILEDEGMGVYVFEKYPEYSITRDDNEIRENNDIIREYTSEEKNYLIFYS